MQNPYARPTASVAPISPTLDALDPDAATFQPAVFSTRGRIGRLRYLAYTGGVNLLAVLAGVAMAVFAGTGVAGAEPAPPENVALAGIALIVAPCLAALVYAFVAARRRLNDLDQSGWLALLLLVPLLNLVLSLYIMLWPGTPGHNRYGPRPTPNSPGVVAGVLIPVLFGIVVGIAVYSYLGMVQAGTLALPAWR
ncbi:MAG: DUF805 domain-containing protein [Pseudomonadota bacterium]